MRDIEILEEKKELRKRIRQLKSNITEFKREEASKEIFSKLADLDVFKKSKYILLYYSMSDEIDTTLFIDKLYKGVYGDKKVLLPLVCGDDLEIKYYNPNELKQGYKGIYEPTGKSIEDINLIDMIIVPGVAFDANCNRMGRGKGFYDRLLSTVKSYKIGVGYNFMIIDNLPHDEYDISLDCIITPECIYR